MLARLRLAWRIQRFELSLLIGACLLLLVTGLVVAWQLRAALDAVQRCMAATTASGCQALARSFDYLAIAGPILHGVVAPAPFLLGLFLGVPIVAREIESGTASLSWSLAGSRRDWLGWRTGSIGLLVVLGAAMAASAGELLTLAAQLSSTDPGFTDYAMRGPLVVARAVAVFGIAVAAGVLVPRQLPALLLAGTVTLAVFLGINFATVQIAHAEAVPLPQDQIDGAYPMLFDSAVRVDATGELISYDDYVRINPELDDDFESGFTPVEFMVPGSRYGEYVLRESAVLVVVALLAGGIALAAVQRRRPY